MSNKIKFAVIGCGRIGHRHCTIIRSMLQAELIAIVETDQSKHSKIKSEFEVPVFENLDQLKNKNLQIDVLCICTPNGLHVQHCLQGLNNGWHILCEKPFGLKTEDCKQVIELSKTLNKKVFCVMQNRYSPPSAWLKSVLPKLGQIYLVQINCFWNRNAGYYKDSTWKGTLNLDGGPLFTQFSHFVDTLFYTFGDLTIKSATFSKNTLQGITEFEDTGIVNFSLTNGGEGTFNYTTAVHQKNLESSVTIIAEKGTIKIGGQYMEEVLCCDIKGYKMEAIPPTNPPNNYGTYKGSAANHGYVFNNVIKALNNELASFTTIQEGLKVVEFIETAYNYR